MTIYPCGIKVTTIIDELEAIITGCNIRYDSIQYELSWFSQGEYKTAWVNESEFKCTSQDKVEIGYR